VFVFSQGTLPADVEESLKSFDFTSPVTKINGENQKTFFLMD
jgi:hypothetical protein